MMIFAKVPLSMLINHLGPVVTDAIKSQDSEVQATLFNRATIKRQSGKCIFNFSIFN